MTFRRLNHYFRDLIIAMALYCLVIFLIGLIRLRESSLPGLLGEALISFLMLLTVIIPLMLVPFLIKRGMDVIFFDDEGITVTMKRLFRKTRVEYTKWSMVTSLKLYSGRGAEFILEACAPFSEECEPLHKLTFGWTREVQEYLVKNHPELPIEPINNTLFRIRFNVSLP